MGERSAFLRENVPSQAMLVLSISRSYIDPTGWDYRPDVSFPVAGAPEKIGVGFCADVLDEGGSFPLLQRLLRLDVGTRRKTADWALRARQEPPQRPTPVWKQCAAVHAAIARGSDVRFGPRPYLPGSTPLPSLGADELQTTSLAGQLEADRPSLVAQIEALSAAGDAAGPFAPHMARGMLLATSGWGSSGSCHRQRWARGRFPTALIQDTVLQLA